MEAPLVLNIHAFEHNTSTRDLNHHQSEFFFENVTGGILFSHGERWQESRRFTLSALRNFGMGKKSIEYRITEEARVLCDTISQLDEFEPSSVLYAAVSNIICSITFGRRFDYDDPVFSDMTERLRAFMSGVDLSPILTTLSIRFPVFLKTCLTKKFQNTVSGLKVNHVKCMRIKKGNPFSKAHCSNSHVAYK